MRRISSCCEKKNYYLLRKYDTQGEILKEYFIKLSFHLCIIIQVVTRHDFSSLLKGVVSYNLIYAKQ